MSNDPSLSSAQRMQVRDLFEAILEEEPPNPRSWLEARCVDAAVRAEVESLLDHHSRAGSFLVDPLADRSPELLAEAGGLEPGVVLGHYTIVRELGRGAMGRVYLASDTRLNRIVALKALPPDLTGDPAYRERLKREAQAAAALRHPGICTVYALEEIDDALFIVSEAIDGHTLRDEIASGRLPSAEAIARTARELADALASAHDEGITHRDLKPENVMRDTSGRVTILDFGLARLPPASPAHDAAFVTAPGAVLGTPAYMAPEQVNGEATDARTDVFAFGVLMYEYACGVHPFDASTPLGRVARLLESDAKPITERCATMPAGIGYIIDRCLSKAPEGRYASAREIVEALDRAGRQATALVRSSRWWRAHQIVVIILYLVACTVAWSIKEAFPARISLWLFIALGIAAAAAGISRGHLVFTDFVNRLFLNRERQRVGPMLRIGDAILTLGLAVDGLWIASVRPLWAVLTIALAIAVALAALVMEPATTAAVFADDGR